MMRNPADQLPTRSRKTTTTTTTPCCSKVGMKRGPWTAEEDEILTEYIKREGEGQWRTLPKRAGLLRCGKSCRLRWMNYLRPHLKRGRISPDEEDLILRLHRLLGNRWSLIAGRIPGRTDNEIKNYWNTHLAKKLISQGLDPRNHKPLINYTSSPPNPNFRSTAPDESALHHLPPNPNPNSSPISATSLPSPLLMNHEASTTGYNNNKNNNNNNRVIMAGCYSSSSHGIEESSKEGGRGMIGYNYSDEMLSFLDSLMMNEDVLVQQPHQADHNQPSMAMQPMTSYGSGYDEGFDYSSSLNWESGFRNERGGSES